MRHNTEKIGYRCLLSAGVYFLSTTFAIASTVTVTLSNAKNDASAMQQTVVALTPINSTAQRAEPNSNRKNRLEVEQLNSQFRPFISIVQRDSDIVFPNRDSIAHHVYSFSQAAQFQSELYSKQQSHAISAKSAGVITVGCNIHDWMLAYIVVVDTPHFNFATGANVELKNVEPGTYQLSYWHPSLTEAVSKTVAVGESEHEQFELSVNLTAIQPPEPPNNSFLEEDDY